MSVGDDPIPLTASGGSGSYTWSSSDDGIASVDAERQGDGRLRRPGHPDRHGRHRKGHLRGDRVRAGTSGTATTRPPAGTTRPPAAGA